MLCWVKSFLLHALHDQQLYLAFSEPNTVRALAWWVISVWNNLPYLLQHFISFWYCFFLQITKRSLAFHSFPKFPVTANHCLFLPLFSACYFKVFLFFIPSAMAESEQGIYCWVGAVLLVAEEQTVLQCATPQKALSSHQVVQDP